MGMVRKLKKYQKHIPSSLSTKKDKKGFAAQKKKLHGEGEGGNVTKQVAWSAEGTKDTEESTIFDCQSQIPQITIQPGGNPRGKLDITSKHTAKPR